MSVRSIYRLSPAPSRDPNNISGVWPEGLRPVSRRGRNDMNLLSPLILRQMDSSQALVALNPVGVISLALLQQGRRAAKAFCSDPFLSIETTYIVSNHHQGIAMDFQLA